MLKIHHLGVSQSDRVVWLMEELGLPYELVWHRRTAEGSMPASYAALHPAATAPVIQDGDRTLAESAVILEYICHTHAGGRMTLGPKDAAYYDYLYWMQLNNNVLGLFFAKLAQGSQPPTTLSAILKRREDGYARLLDQTLADRPFLCGDDLTCADIMVLYGLRSPRMLGGREDTPNVTAYVERLSRRPAYIRAMDLVGPQATPPEGA